MKISKELLQQIVKEEALRLKKRMMLEAERTAIQKKLQEMEECGMMEEAPAAAGAEVQIKPEVEAAVEKNVQAVVSKITPDQAAQAQQELEALGIAPGASPEQIKGKIEAMLPVSEAMMTEAWDKSKLYNWLVGGGLGATLAGIVTAAVGALPLEKATALADYTGGSVSPTPAIIAGLVAAALGVASVVVGMKGKEKMAPTTKMSPEQAAAIIAKRKAAHGR